MPEVRVHPANPRLTFDPLRPNDDDPYPLYRRLRDEAPLYRNEEWDFWAVSRYEDVHLAARDWETFSSAEGNDLDESALLFAPAGELTHADPPLHTRLRDVVKREFGISTVQNRLEPLVRARVQHLIASIYGRERIDLAAELAIPLSVSVICLWLGFPESDHAHLLSCFRATQARTPGEVRLPPAALAGCNAIRDYFVEAVVARHRLAQDDLLTVIAKAESEGTLSEDEAVGAAILLFAAGMSSTSALLSNSLLHLQNFGRQRELLCETPSIIPLAVEELLRFDAPFQWFTRVTTRDVEVHERRIPAGARVVLLWASANRDERRWDRPDELDLKRDPKRHIAFGEGIHHCLGAPLARLEAKVLLAELMPRIAEYQIAGPVQRVHTASERTITNLPAHVLWS